LTKKSTKRRQKARQRKADKRKKKKRNEQIIHNPKNEQAPAPTGPELFFVV